jgi:hypothetical protein
MADKIEYIRISVEWITDPQHSQAPGQVIHAARGIIELKGKSRTDLEEVAQRLAANGLRIILDN